MKLYLLIIYNKWKNIYKMFIFYLVYKFFGVFFFEKVKYSLKKDRECLIIWNNILWKILFMWSVRIYYIILKCIEYFK